MADAYGAGAVALFDWLLTAGASAAVLLAAVAVCGKVFGRWMTPAGRAALWLLVLARLAMPSVGSPTSVYNALSGFGANRSGHADQGDAFGVAKVTYGSVMARPRGTEASGAVATGRRQPWWVWGAVTVWGVGVVVCLGRVVFLRGRLGRVIRDAARVTDAGVLRVMDGCRAAMNVGQPVALRESAAVSSPALAGEFRAALLVPPGLLDRLSPAELRWVFLHELAHLRRKDLLVDRVLDVLRAVHWFNPVVHVAVGRYRAERELARDAMVLAAVKPGERSGYGGTLIRLGQWLGPCSIPAASVGMTEPKRELRRRVEAVASYRGRRWSGAVFATFLVVALGLILLPGRATAQAEDAQPARTPATVPTAVGSADLMVETRVLTVGRETLGLLPGGLEAPAGTADPASSFLTDAQVAAFLTAAQKAGDTTTLTAPRLTLHDGQQGKVRIGQDVAYIAAVKPGPDGKPTAPDVAETGLTIEVAGTAAADRAAVTTKFKVESTVLREMRKMPAPDGSGAEVQLPILDRRQVESAVAIPAGRTLVVLMKADKAAGGDARPASEHLVLMLKPTLVGKDAAAVQPAPVTPR